MASLQKTGSNSDNKKTKNKEISLLTLKNSIAVDVLETLIFLLFSFPFFFLSRLHTQHSAQ